MSDFWDALDDDLSFINGLEDEDGGSHYDDFAQGSTIFEEVCAYLADELRLYFDNRNSRWLAQAYRSYLHLADKRLGVERREHEGPWFQTTKYPTKWGPVVGGSVSTWDDTSKPIIDRGFVWNRELTEHDNSQNWLKARDARTKRFEKGQGETLEQARRRDKTYIQTAQERAKELERLARLIRFYSAAERPTVYSGPWPMSAHVLVRPEGWGKSSLVKLLVDKGFRVVFCAKTNDQLFEQIHSFKARWPDLTIHRYVSKAQNLKERLASIGVEKFELINGNPNSPYAAPSLDKYATLRALRKALDDAGYHLLDHVRLFEEEYKFYNAPTPQGWSKESGGVNVLMMTIAAFQAHATSWNKPWWEKLGYSIGSRDIEDREGKFITLPIADPRIAVIIDDPDKADFDRRRWVEADDAEQLYHSRRLLKGELKPLSHWLERHSPHTAQMLYDYNLKKRNDRAEIHKLESVRGGHFEKRPWRSAVGFGFRRGIRGSNRWGSAQMIVTTTERITAKYALRTLRDQGLTPKLDEHLPITRDCHVTLLASSITLSRNHALLIPIFEKLKQEFPEDQVALIADGLGCELNLMNNRGRNDLAHRSTIIKLSIPNPVVARTLWAHFPDSEKPSVLNTILLADLANQALGRNQGIRWQGRPAILLVAPFYAKAIVASGLLRYEFTPWSSHRPQNTGLVMHGDVTPLERRLVELINDAERFGRSDAAQKLCAGLTPKQRMTYDTWLKQGSQGTDRVTIEAAPDAADAAY